jgi:putative colanic acid biosynthesis UDP-glucose lipid carrier transferase
VLVYVTIALSRGQTMHRADLLLCLLVFILTFPGRNRFRENRLATAVDIVSSWAILLSILLLCGYATLSLQFFDGNVLVLWAVVTPFAQAAAVYVGQEVIRWQIAQPAARRGAVIVGAGPVSDVAKYVSDHGVREVYITLPLGLQPRILELLESAQGTTASLYFVPDVFGISIIQGRLQDVNGVPVVSILETPFTGANALVKRVSDIVIGSLILVLISPLLLAIAIGVKLSSPGPVIFKQRRNGLDGEQIIVYKFRSMTTQDDGPVVKQATKGDPRITPFGAFLRRTSLDELPQFINVLQGRMSIVGPRPHAVAHNDMYRELIKAYMVRHKVKPGITGWAQVNGFRGETETIEKMRGRVEYDLEYLRNWSLALDLQIIARTARLVLFDRNAH